MVPDRKIVRQPVLRAAALIMMGCVFAPLFSAELPAGVLARLGDAAVTSADVEAAMLKVPADKRAGVLSSPERVGNLLRTLLLRRAMASDADQWLSRDQLLAVRAQAHTEALAGLALMLIPQVNDERAIEQKARALYSEWAAESERTRLSFELVTVLADDLGWQAAEALAAEVHAEIQAGRTEFQESGIEAESFDRIEASQLAPDYLARMEPLKPGEIAGPYTTPLGYQILIFRNREVAPPPTFADTRRRWTDQARDLLNRAGRRELSELHDQDELAGMARSRGLAEDPVGAAYVRQAEEEAVLAASKKAYLEQELPDDVSALARERYIAYRDNYRTQPTADIAVVKVRGLDDPQLDRLRDEFAARVVEHGLADLEGYVASITDAPVVSASHRQAVPFKILKPELERTILTMVAEERSADVSEANGVITFAAVENFEPSRQKSYSEVADDIEATLIKELSEVAWRRRTEPYYHLELQADPEAIASLRVAATSG